MSEPSEELDVRQELWKVYRSMGDGEPALRLKALELIAKVTPPPPPVKGEGRDPSLQRALRNVAQGKKGA